MGRLADVVEKVLERRVDRNLATIAELEAQLKADPNDGMKKYRVSAVRRVQAFSSQLTQITIGCIRCRRGRWLG